MPRRAARASRLDPDIWGQLDSLTADRAIAAFGDRQKGVVARWQLEPLRLGKEADWRLATGRLRLLHRGVYAVGHRALTPDGWRWAAVLAGGPAAVLSHASAGALWGLRPDALAKWHVTVPSQAGRRRPRIVVHRCATLQPDEIAEHDGIPCTSVARTLLDMAAGLQPHQLSRAVEQADIKQLLDMQGIEPLLARRLRHPGATKLRGALVLHADASPFTRSDFEAKLAWICQAAGLPFPALNALVPLPRGGHAEVDALWPAQRLVLELDGFETHGTRAAFERDRARDAELLTDGYRVLRVTWRRLRDEPQGVAATLKQLLAYRS